MSKNDGRERTGKARPLPRRLLSFDKFRTQSSARDSVLSTGTSNIGYESSEHERAESVASTIRPEADPFADRASTPQHDLGKKERRATPDFAWLPDTSMRAAEPPPSKSSSKFRLNRPPPILPSSPSPFSETEIPASPSKKRWDHIRQQVLPAHASQPSQLSLSSVISPSRDGTTTPAQSTGRSTPNPKAPRFGGKRFMKVVEEAKSIAPPEPAPPPVAEPTAFEKELRLACWAARFGPNDLASAGVSRSGHMQREATQASMVSTFKPFTASALVSSASMSSNNLSNSSQSSIAPSRRPASVSQLHSTLFSHASASDQSHTQAAALPMESEVLAALLLPFFPQTNPLALASADDERSLATEAFEVATKTWAPQTPEAELDRVLWICRAASLSLPTSSVRTHLLGTLYSALFPRKRVFPVNSPGALRTLVQGLIRLQATSVDPDTGYKDKNSSESRLLDDLLEQVSGMNFTPLDVDAVEKAYGVRRNADEDLEIRQGIVYEATAQALSWLGPSQLPWLIQILMDSWNPLGTSPSPMMCRIVIQNHSVFLEGAVRIVDSLGSVGPTTALLGEVFKSIVRHTRDYTLPNLIQLREGLDTAVVCMLSARVLIGIATLSRAASRDSVSPSAPASDHALECLESLLRLHGSKKEWKIAFTSAFAALIPPSGDWNKPAKILDVLVEEMADDVTRVLLSIVLPGLNDRLVSHFPQNTSLIAPTLQRISVKYPQIFYKPMFACAAAMKDATIINHIRIFSALTKLVPDFWTRDAEMTAVAATGDIGSAAPSSSDTKASSMRLGQVVLLIHVIGCLKTARLEKAKLSDPAREQTQSLRSVNQFALNFEARLGAVIMTKDDGKFLQWAPRGLYCALFAEARLLTRSLRSSSWLTHVISWTIASFNRDQDLDYYGSSSLGDDDDLSETLDRVSVLFEQAGQTVDQSDAKTTRVGAHDARMLSPGSRSFITPNVPELGVENSEPKGTLPLDGVRDAVKNLLVLKRGFLAISLPLLVALSAIIVVDDYCRLASALWNHGLINVDRSTTTSSCFLLLQAAERAQKAVIDMILLDVRSSSISIRRTALHRLEVLYASRFELLSQLFIVDRNHPRPFRQARPQSALLTTDIGSARHVRRERPDDNKMQKQLSEIGWEHDGATSDTKQATYETPMMLIPLRQLEVTDRDNTGSSPPPSPQPSPRLDMESSNSNKLLRRHSSGANHTSRKRAIFVTSLGMLVPHLVQLVFDKDHATASEARLLFLHIMKEDPSLALRPVFDLLMMNDRIDEHQAFSTLTAYSHVVSVLPPAMAHAAFNHLTGFLKYLKQAQNSDSLRLYAATLPFISAMATHVSEVSLKEFRKHKIDVFLVPSWDLWFQPGAPAGPMFPQYPLESIRSDERDQQLRYVTAIRVAQNNLLSDMLQHNIGEIQLLRKNPARLVLPDDQDAVTLPLGLSAFIPSLRDEAMPIEDDTARLSKTLSLSYILLVTQIFRLLPAHLNDRSELEVYMDGLNRALTKHGNDSLIVIHVMNTLIWASSRFKRLFSSTGGFQLFLPAVMKVYAESLPETNWSHVHHNAGGTGTNIICDAIDYAISQFYAQHSETFLFQLLEVLSRMFKLQGYPERWASTRLFRLFVVLERGGPAYDTSGLAGVDRNDRQMKPSTQAPADERPQTFTLRRNANTSSASTGHESRPSDFMALRYEDERRRRFKLDNLVRLFLTVIAHNPAVVRAQNFLRLMRSFIDPLCSTSAVGVLREGIDALGAIVLVKAASKAKVPELSQLKSPLESGQEIYSHDKEITSAVIQENTTSPSDLTTMRIDLLRMAVSFVTNGQVLPAPTCTRLYEIVRMLSTNPTQERLHFISSFLGDYVRPQLTRDPPIDLRSARALLNNMASLAEELESKVDLSGLLGAVAIAFDTTLTQDSVVQDILLKRFCSLGIRARLSNSGRSAWLGRPSDDPVAQMFHCAIQMSENNTLVQLEGHDPTPQLLVHLIIPLILRLRADIHVIHEAGSTSGGRQATIWGRLLGYLLRGMDADNGASEHLHRTPSLSSVRRSRSPSFARPSTASLGYMRALTIQAIKIIVLKADASLPRCIPDIWLRMTNFLMQFLVSGDASFAVTKQADALSPMPTSAISPQLASTTESHAPIPRTPVRQDSSGSRKSSMGTRINPRLMDYILWTTFELLIHRPHPLLLTLRPLMQTKTSAVHHILIEASMQPATLFHHDHSRYSQSPSAITDRLTKTGSLFVKPRRRSAMISPLSGGSVSQGPSPAGSPVGTPRSSFVGLPSPSGSPLPSPSITKTRPSTLRVPNVDEFGFGRAAGYARNSITSPIAGPGGRFITHLGPPSSPLSPSGQVAHTTEGSALGPLEVRLATDELVAKTYGALRAVQAYMGYSRFVDWPEGLSEPRTESGRPSRATLIAKAAEDARLLLLELNRKTQMSDMVAALAVGSASPSPLEAIRKSFDN